MDKIALWDRLCALSRFVPKLENGDRRLVLNGCCGSISSSTGSIFVIRRWKMRSLTRRRCAVSRALILAGRQRRTKRPIAACAICLRGANRERRFSAWLNAHLADRGVKVTTGTILDTAIISAPSSTKNAGTAREPEMHQTRKGNAWHFGMKAHVGVDSKTRVIHCLRTTPANVADSAVLGDLLHGG